MVCIQCGQEIPYGHDKQWAGRSRDEHRVERWLHKGCVQARIADLKQIVAEQDALRVRGDALWAAAVARRKEFERTHPTQEGA